MPRVLFVCTANVCRSPVAEAYFVDWLKRNSIEGDWQVGSAGTWARPGERASPLSVDILKTQGLDLTTHRARRVDAAMLAEASIVLCMTHSHQEALRVEFPAFAAAVQVLSAMAGPAFDIDDPYGGPREAYLEMTDEVRGLIEVGGPRIVSLANRAEASSD
jgi:protein-tyrosine phosphatase